MLNHTLSILRSLIGYDTTSRNSNLELIHFVQEYLQSHEVVSHLIHDETGKKANLLATIGESLTGGVIFSGHTDVVPVDGQAWHTPPFVMTEKDGKLYGRGTADMKGFLAVVLACVPEWVKQPLARPIHLAFSYDEEVGCIGAHSLVDAILAHGIRPSLAVIGEPTEMKVIHSHKGIYSFLTTVKGHEAHSSAVHKGVSAIMIAAQLIEVLSHIQEMLREEANPMFDPPYSSVQVGVIHGGTAQNIIPGECHFQWEIRVVPGSDIEAITAPFHAKVAELLPKMQAIAPEADIITISTSHTPALMPNEDTSLEHAVLHAAGCNHMEVVSFGTEAGIFQQAGIPAIICGPGSIMQAHKPDEFIAVEQIEKAMAFVRSLTV